MYQTHELLAMCSSALGPFSSRPAIPHPQGEAGADAAAAAGASPGSSRLNEVGGVADESLSLRLAIMAEAVGAGEHTSVASSLHVFTSVSCMVIIIAIHVGFRVEGR